MAKLMNNYLNSNAKVDFLQNGSKLKWFQRSMCPVSIQNEKFFSSSFECVSIGESNEIPMLGKIEMIKIGFDRFVGVCLSVFRLGTQHTII